MKPPHAPLQRESLYFMSLALILAGRYPVPPLDSGSPFRSSLCVGLSDPFFKSLIERLACSFFGSFGHLASDSVRF